VEGRPLAANLFADDTIVAISTPPGRGGIGVVRLSGERALDEITGETTVEDILDRIFSQFCIGK